MQSVYRTDVYLHIDRSAQPIDVTREMLREVVPSRSDELLPDRAKRQIPAPTGWCTSQLVEFRKELQCCHPVSERNGFELFLARQTAGEADGGVADGEADGGEADGDESDGGEADNGEAGGGVADGGEAGGGEADGGDRTKD